MITTITRLLLARQIGPFAFRPEPDFLPDMNVPHYGLYVHVPFCEKLCAFCPYYKTLYDKDLTDRYVEALLREIDIVSARLGNRKKPVGTLYFGGGSPALVAGSLKRIIGSIADAFGMPENIGLELHPRDVNAQIPALLKDVGVTMVSLGVQSFQTSSLAALGRTDIHPLESVRLLAEYSFKALDVDLIFGIPGQTPEDLAADFKTAADSGATQISTYPFIDFSYAQNLKKPLGRRAKKKMLETLLGSARSAGFVRTSVWTFGKAGSPHYSSITRDNFIGFGPSATSLGRSDFKTNTFSVESYIDSVGKNKIPTALRLRFNERTRGMYWLFWNCYNGIISSNAYYSLFDRVLESDFGFYLRSSVSLGLSERLEADGDVRWTLTARGSYLFHLVEQKYTSQYIDKTWKASLESPWPHRINLY